MENFLLAITKLLVSLINLVPLQPRRRFCAFILRVLLILFPRHKRRAMENLKLAFPDKDPAWRKEIFKQSLESFARFIVDELRLAAIDAAWVEKNFEFPLELYNSIRAKYPGLGIIYATGHLGSFDLMGHCIPYLMPPMGFVVRNFKLQKFDEWWSGIREMDGNLVIPRKGALKGVLKAIKEGRDTAILFDQNVRAEFAEFVDWFGVPAATTALPAIVATRLQAPVVVASMEFLGGDRYRVNYVPVDFSALYADQSLSNKEKVHEITRRISEEYEKMIRANPAEWFWMHRRWRTRPPV